MTKRRKSYVPKEPAKRGAAQNDAAIARAAAAKRRKAAKRISK